jgi:hypothetical protein
MYTRAIVACLMFVACASKQVREGSAPLPADGGTRSFELTLERRPGEWSLEGELHGALSVEQWAKIEEVAPRKSRIFVTRWAPDEPTHRVALDAIIAAGLAMQSGDIKVGADGVDVRGSFRDEAAKAVIDAALERAKAALGVELRAALSLDALDLGEGEGFVLGEDDLPFRGMLVAVPGGEQAAMDIAGRVRAGLYRDPDTDIHYAVRAGQANRIIVRDASGKGPPTILVGGKRFALDERLTTSVVGEPGAFGEVVAYDAKGRVVWPTGPDGKPLFGFRTGKAKPSLLPDGLLARRNFIQTALLHGSTTATHDSAYRMSVGQSRSDHFIINFDGTVHQTLDVGWAAIHADAVDPTSIAINLVGPLPNLELAPDTLPFDPNNPRHAPLLLPEFARTVSGRMEINGARVRSYGFTEAQYRALGTLLRTLAGVFPAIERGPPRDHEGAVVWRRLSEPTKATGVIAHFHTDSQRWDPGPGFDWERLGLERRHPLAGPKASRD